MSIAERRSSTKPSFRIPVPSENAVLATVAFALLLFHILGATMMYRALPNEPVARLKEAIASYGD
jgi:hypothetical protein